MRKRGRIEPGMRSAHCAQRLSILRLRRLRGVNRIDQHGTVDQGRRAVAGVGCLSQEPVLGQGAQAEGAVGGRLADQLARLGHGQGLVKAEQVNQ
jgi:hypothetical protein